MKIIECISCGRRSFEPRALCPVCRSEAFSELQCDITAEIVSTEMAVTPAGFEERHILVLGKCGSTVVFYSKESRSA